MGFGAAVLDQVKSFAQRASALLDLEAQKRKTYQPKPEETKLLKLVSDAQRVRLFTLDSYEAGWLKAILYAAGQQHLQYISANRRFEQEKVDDWVPLPTINLIQPPVQRIVDMLTRNRPVVYVEPNSDREDDRQAAQLGERVLRSIWDRIHMEERLDDAATWLPTVGNVIAKTYVDMSMPMRTPLPRYQKIDEPIEGLDGQPVLDPETGQPVTVSKWVEQRDPATGGVLFDEIQEGQVVTRIVSPFGFTAPLGAAVFPDDAPWCMDSSIYPTQLLRDLYPEYADYIPETGSALSQDTYQHRLSSMLVGGAQGFARTMDPTWGKGFGIVNHFERAPDRVFKNGLMIIEFDGIPLVIDELPRRTQYSFEHCGYYRVPNRFWYRGVVEDCITPQDQINKLEQFLQLNDARNCFPQWSYPIEASIPDSAFSGKPGVHLPYNYPYEPRRYEGMGLPPEIVQRKQLYFEDIQEITGVRHVLMGNTPPGVTAGVAINRLGEEAEGIFSPITKRWERFLERVGTAQLELAQRYYSLPRHLVVDREGGGVEEIRDFAGMQLAGNTRVRVETGSYRPRSKAGQQQTLFDAHNAGLMPELITDPGERGEFLEQIGVVGFHPQHSLDWKRAKWENEMLSRAVGWQRVRRQAGDDDEIHLQVHTDYAKTEEWLRLPQMIQQRHMLHRLEHMQAWEERLAAGAGPNGSPGANLNAPPRSRQNGGEEVVARGSDESGLPSPA